jgi:cytochrome d ubiquinol oxidase subunit I
VTEVGRQPWIVYNVMRTKDAVTKSGGLWVTFTLVILLYALLGAVLVISLRALSRRWRAAGDEEADVPYGPSGVAPSEVGP